MVGYKDSRNGTQIGRKGLKSLEYRGYDSWGMASLNGKTQTIDIIKKVGKIDEITLKDLPLDKTRVCLGHTRWATHGQVTEKNAHPRRSQNKNIAVVPNGIIENFQPLCSFLKSQGFTFASETDSEIFPHFIQYHMDKGLNFEHAVKETSPKQKEATPSWP